MERKIGEIFEYNGEWYQCVEGVICLDCSFSQDGCTCDINGKLNCTRKGRNDNKSVVFKKLEKVGEPFSCNYYGDKRLIMMQEYRAYDNRIIPPNGIPMYVTDEKHKKVAIEIRQNQENMEENKLNLKPFDLEAARSGKPVCTRDGRKARIICFDAKGDKPIIALVEAKGNKDALIEEVERYFINGHSVFEVRETNDDLMMLPEKKEGWVNVYRDCDGVNITKDDNIYSSKDAAIASAQVIDRDNYVATTIINWEE